MNRSRIPEAGDHRRRSAFLRTIGSATFLLVALVVLTACGSAGGGDARLPDVEPAVVLDTYRAAPGESVRLEARGLPPRVVVDLGVGPPASEYEVLAAARTDARGRLERSVDVPAHARAGSEWVFVVAERGGPDRTKAVSAVLVIDGPNGGRDVLSLTGRLTDEGVECPALRGDDGALYTLTGALEGLEPGMRVRVRGRLAEISLCMQGTTIAVESAQRLPE